MRVLLVVDVQNGFCPGGELAVPGGNEVVAVVNRLMSDGNYDLVVATKDWHPANHVSFVDNHAGKKPFELIELAGGRQILWPRHCEQGTTSADFHPELEVTRIDKIIQKGTDASVDSYSGFFDNDGKRETGLREFLDRIARAAKIDRSEITITVCGLATDYCVAWTAKDAKKLGFDVELCVDASRAVNMNPGDDVKALREAAALGIKLTESREILGGMSREVKVARGLEITA